MKKIIIKGIAAVLIGAGMTSCSDDYLDLMPVTTVDETTVYSTVEGAKLALNGVCKAMYTQYQDLAITPNFNGEPFFCNFYGEMLGSDAFYLVWAQRNDGTLNQWLNNTDVDGSVPGYAWRYPYNLIGQCNVILRGEETAQGDASERAMVMAQARTIRAHAYIRLLQCFAPRWEDSDNGNKKCIVLRTEFSTADAPAVSMNEILDLVYGDLDKAIELYGKANGQSRGFIWRPDISVAKGLYARVAMIKHDYATAQKMANEARASYKIMTADQYKSGFCEANDEWMWANSIDEQVYYWAYGSWFACDGPYPVLWGYGAGAINYDLYKKIPTTDVRAGLYFTPELAEKLYEEGEIGKRVSKARFWNKIAVNPTTMSCMNGAGDMQDAVAAANHYTIPGKNLEKFGEAYANRFGQTAEKGVSIPFGAQYKFWAVDTYGRGQFPFMRASEMLLTEAEAAYHNGDMTTAKNCLKELYDKRNPGQVCDQTGEGLLDEIRTQRRVELWGEGFCWFDLKRWNMPMVRRAWVEKDQNSNNIPQAYEITIDPTHKGWKFVIPSSEYMYNHAVIRGELD